MVTDGEDGDSSRAVELWAIQPQPKQLAQPQRPVTIGWHAQVMDTCADVRSSSPTSGGGFATGAAAPQAQSQPLTDEQIGVKP